MCDNRGVLFCEEIKTLLKFKNNETKKESN